MTTAMPRTMPYKKSINILPSNIATVQICSARLHVSVLKLAQAMTAFNSKGRCKNLATVGTCSPEYTELCHFALLFCRRQQKNGQRFKDSKRRTTVLLIKPFVC